jgi:hypothetical protein
MTCKVEMAGNGFQQTVRLGWKLPGRLELNLCGKNLTCELPGKRQALVD